MLVTVTTLSEYETFYLHFQDKIFTINYCPQFISTEYIGSPKALRLDLNQNLYS